MQINMGSTDKATRITLAVVIAILYYNQLISGTWAIVLGTISLVFIITSLFGVCPLYSILGINTCKRT
jgi:Protein of unknown function (DUF2892)